MEILTKKIETLHENIVHLLQQAEKLSKDIELLDSEIQQLKPIDVD